MKVLSFGEVLWDVYPVKECLGGAPMNFSAHLACLGCKSYILSAVGNDLRGKNTIEMIQALNVKTDYISVNQYSTGVCNVTYNSNEPIYDLSHIDAYDYIECEDIEKLNKQEFDVFYFGTLAQRSEKSRETLLKVLNNLKFKHIFFDLNLRQHYYNPEVILDGLKTADIVKINRDEYDTIKKILNYKGEDKEFIISLCLEYNIKVLLLTLDKDGAVVYDGNFYYEPCTDCEFVSAVGAGDSFSACFLKNYISGEPIEKCLKRANMLAGYVVGFETAIPPYSEELKKQII